MTVTNLTKDTLDDFVTNNDIGLIDFWASWCGPCRYFAPIFESAAARYPDIGFGKVNTEEQSDLAANFNIMSIPTLIAFRDGMILYAQPGALPEEALDDLVEQIREVDMEQVRRQLQETA